MGSNKAPYDHGHGNALASALIFQGRGILELVHFGDKLKDIGG